MQDCPMIITIVWHGHLATAPKISTILPKAQLIVYEGSHKVYSSKGGNPLPSLSFPGLRGDCNIIVILVVPKL